MYDESKTMKRSFLDTPEIPIDATFGEILDDITHIAESGDGSAAERYKQKLVTRRRLVRDESMLDSEQAEAENVGYLSGYLTTEQRLLVCQIFKTTHPIFGDTDPTPEEAFQMGVDWVKERSASAGEE